MKEEGLFRSNHDLHGPSSIEYQLPIEGRISEQRMLT